jgi:hypothetical protein
VTFQWNLKICYTNKKIRNDDGLPLPPFIDELHQLNLEEHGLEFNLDAQKKEYMVSQHFPHMISVKMCSFFFFLNGFGALRGVLLGQHTYKLEHLLFKKTKLDA